MPDPCISGGTDAAVLLPDHGQPVTIGSKLLWCVIRGAVVNDDQLEAAAILRQDRIDCLSEAP